MRLSSFEGYETAQFAADFPIGVVVE